MIAQLRGRLVEKNPTDVVIDCGGVGYHVNISLHTYEQLGDTESITLFTHLQVREDAQILWGFAQKVEREIFLQLLSVNGIGAATARTMLSSLTPQQVAQGIAGGDVRMIQSVKGIGAKTAQRVIIDLKDKILGSEAIQGNLNAGGNTNRDEALSALETLGFTRKAIDKVLDAIQRQNAAATTEQLIKEALKQL